MVKLNISNSTTAKKGQQVDEDHDYIHVENQCADDVVINGELVAFATHDELSIHDEVDAEQEDANRAYDHLENVASEDKPEEAKDEESHSSNEDDAPLCGEVSLSSASVGSACSRDSYGASSSANYGLTVFEVVNAVLSSPITFNLEGGDHAEI